MKPLIFDATPLIYLGKVNLIEKVKHFTEEKYITKALVSSGVFQIKNPANEKYMNHLAENPKIHEADIDVLGLVQEMNGIALLDDEEARGMAEVEEIEHHGTIYLLLRMRKMRLLTREELLVGLNEMIRMGWRCSTELYAEILMGMNLMKHSESRRWQ